MTDPHGEGEQWWLMTAEGLVPIPREPRGVEYPAVDTGLDVDAFVAWLTDEPEVES